MVAREVKEVIRIDLKIWDIKRKATRNQSCKKYCILYYCSLLIFLFLYCNYL